MLGTDFGPVPYGVREHIDDVKSVFSDTEDQAKVLWKNSERWFHL
jgi:hypothetical protein